MDSAPPGIRRMCIAVAAGAVPGRDAAGARRALARGSAALGNACRAAGLDRVLVGTKHADETEVALLPAGIDEPRAVAELVSSLAAELNRANGNCRAAGRVRLRMAVHEGVTILTAGGFAGRAVDRVRWLATAPPLEHALDAHPGADLIVLLSGQVYDDVTQFGEASLPPGQFQCADIAGTVCGYRDTAWIYVPPRAGP